MFHHSINCFNVNGGLRLKSRSNREDFEYAEQALVLKEWDRVLRVGGVVVVVAPDQARFVEYCALAGHPPNPHHKESDMGLKTFLQKPWLAIKSRYEILSAADVEDDYSFYIAARKKE
jgi:hypothetical protein